MNNNSRIIIFVGFCISSLVFLSDSVSAFSFSFENKINNDYNYTVELDGDDSLAVGDRLILSNLSGVTDATSSSPYSITSSDFDPTSANFIIDTALSGGNTLTGVISVTSADNLDNLEYQAFYSDNGTPRVAYNSNIVAVPFDFSGDLGILLLLCGFGLRQLKHNFNDKS